jgi:uncharacterized protein
LVELTLNETPQNPIIIEGSPGFGLVGTIATEFLLEHLETRLIGNIFMPDLPAMVAIHNSEVVQPIGIFYNEKFNIIIVHVIANTHGLEWQLAEDIIELAKQTNAKQVITLEGVASGAEQTDKSPIMFFANRQEQIDVLKGRGLEPLKDGIVMGVTSALMLKGKEHDLSALFALTHSQLPDSKAAAELIKVLDKHLELNIDYEPLLKTAELFEGKLKSIMTDSQKALGERDKKAMSYVG